MAFITSRGTLDKQHSLLRETLAQQADLVAAIRLPNTAFKQNANTEVTTDIVFLRKRLPGEKPAGPAWLESKPMNVGGPEPVHVNEYYHKRVDMMLGRMHVAGHGGQNRDFSRADGAAAPAGGPGGEPPGGTGRHFE